MKSFFTITLVTLCLYISVDFIFGFHILNLFKSKDLRVQSHEFGYHNFSHSFDGYEGNIRYCTNKYGFRISCSKKNKEYSKNFEIFFIGDSFTEGYQVDYDYTFVGIIENNTKKKIANLAVSSYSPTIYYEKIKYFIKKGFKFEHLVVYIDISDISDEAVHYSDSLTLKRKIKNSIRNLFPFSYFVLKKLTIKKKKSIKNIK